MKITKFEHSCLLVEMPAPTNRTALFDPGTMSEGVLPVDDLVYLDDIIITHGHPDHVSVTLVQQLRAKFPQVRITAPTEVVTMLADEGITDVSDQPSEGIEFFSAPHEDVKPLFPQPEQYGVHYLDLFTHPGDSHSFTETKAVLALPVTAPWGAAVTALHLAMELKPQYVLPIHDWHWKQEARDQTYPRYKELLAEQGITFVDLQNGEPVVLEVESQ